MVAAAGLQQPRARGATLPLTVPGVRSSAPGPTPDQHEAGSLSGQNQPSLLSLTSQTRRPGLVLSVPGEGREDSGRVSSGKVSNLKTRESNH